jgi:hypothetical protein
LLKKICADEARLEGILRENRSAHFKERACEINRMVIAIKSHHNELFIAITKQCAETRQSAFGASGMLPFAHAAFRFGMRQIARRLCMI